jgi:hypothetical protein
MIRAIVFSAQPELAARGPSGVRRHVLRHVLAASVRSACLTYSEP